MKRSILIYTTIFFALFIIFSCGHIEKLPTVSEAEQGDTSYVQMFPSWEKDVYNFNTPKDIIVGGDGYLFIADSGNSRIVVLDQAGLTITEDEYGNNFQGLAEISIPGKGNVQPLRLGQDSKMNLLFTDGGNQIYAWNQHYNNVGIDFVASNITLKNNDSGDLMLLSRIDSLTYYLDNGYSMIDADFENNEELIDSILAPHIFFNGDDPINYEFVDDYGNTRNTKIVDLVAFGKDYSNGIYILDKRYNRIVKLIYIPKYVLVLSDLSTVIGYEAVFSEVATGQGTGAGFVMEPKSINMDVSGNVYFTQTGGVYSCHGISAGSYRTLFDPGEDDLLDIGRFKSAWDVSVDSRGIIYVVDALSNYIQTFDNRGNFLRNVATTLVTVDTTFIDTVYSYEIDSTVFPYDTTIVDSSVVEIDSTVSCQLALILQKPEAIAINQNILYIADTGNSRIVRFQYIIMTEQNLQDLQEYQNP
ncbi:MAG: hypothetical protein KAX28_05875 [Candidatus Marinimicrobia bacterium]|nr:hypothetical protein [Candidatus Neomarinimicrobiota bacterium]